MPRSALPTAERILSFGCATASTASGYQSSTPAVPCRHRLSYTPSGIPCRDAVQLLQLRGTYSVRKPETMPCTGYRVFYPHSLQSGPVPPASVSLAMRLPGQAVSVSAPMSGQSYPPAPASWILPVESAWIPPGLRMFLLLCTPVMNSTRDWQSRNALFWIDF